MVKVKLTHNEMWLAVNVGARRELESIRKGSPPGHGIDPDLGIWRVDIEGAAGEIAVAKLLGMYWEGGVNTYKRGDVGPYQVRTALKHNYRLIIRNDDADDEVFILVTGRSPEFVIRGWIRGADARRDIWMDDGGNGRERAYFVPQEALRPIEELVGMPKSKSSGTGS